MDIQPTSQQPISDDQELAKVLAGVNQQANEVAAQADTDTAAPAGDTPDQAAPAEQSAPAESQPADETAAPAESNMTPPVSQPEPAAPASNMPTPSTPSATPSTSGDSELDSIKQNALQELRPLVDKLNVSPEEKFDTYLLLLRSTDDKALIAPAHDAAKGIADEARRAQALLDIIKEIDYLAGPQQSQPAS